MTHGDGQLPPQVLGMSHQIILGTLSRNCSSMRYLVTGGQTEVRGRESIIKSDGEIVARMQQPLSNQPRRNEQCPCGSGKKYKHCCGSFE
jgi:hypothetical protein